MLTNRQLSILQFLLEKPLSGTELALRLESSRRTIVRDVAILDDWLIAHRYGKIDNLQRYSLVVNKLAEIQNEIQKLAFQKHQVLYQVLIHQTITSDELAETLFMPKKDLDETLKKLNKEYQYLFTIERKVGKGNLINVSDYERINLIASLLFSFEELLKEQPLQLTQKVQLYLQKQGHSELLTTIRLYETHQQLLMQVSAYFICQQNQPLKVSFTEYLKQKLLKIDKIKNFNLTKIIIKMNQDYKVPLEIKDCATTITQHLQRTLAFPSYFEGDVNEQFKALKIEYPFIFEFAQSLTEELQLFLAVLYIDSRYIGLYMINAQKANISPINVLMYEERHSISSINQKLMTDQIQSIQLQIVHASSELEDAMQNSKNVILIADRNQITKILKFKVDYIFDGLMNNKDLGALQKIVETKSIQHEIISALKPENFVHVTTETTFEMTINKGLKQLQGQGGLTLQQVQAIKKREAAGNQLIVGQLSIPHIRAEIEEPFKLYYLKLSTSIKVQSTKISAILVVVVSMASNEYTQLFLYLYKKFKQVDLEKIQTRANLLDIFTKK